MDGENCARYNRDHLRYPSDLTDAEWIEIAPLIGPARSGGRRREVDVRNLVNGVMYVLSTGCQWRYIPRTFRPRALSIAISGTGAGTGPWIASMMRSTSNAGKNSASRPVRALASSIARASRAQKKGVRIDPHGFDAGKLIKGKKRHILVDMQGLVLHALITPANVQDRDGGLQLLSTLFWNVSVSQKALRRQRLPGACVSNRARIGSAAPRNRNHQTAARGQGLRRATQTMDCRTGHRVVEPLRRLAKDWENPNISALIFLRLASIRLMLRKLCNSS